MGNGDEWTGWCVGREYVMDITVEGPCKCACVVGHRV